MSIYRRYHQKHKEIRAQRAAEERARAQSFADAERAHREALANPSVGATPAPNAAPAQVVTEQLSYDGAGSRKQQRKS